MSVDEFLGYAGMTMDGLIEQSLATLDFSEFSEGFEESGNYKAIAGNLYLSDGEDFEIDKNVYDTYIITDTTLTMVEHFGSDEDNSFYPIEFVRVS